LSENTNNREDVQVIPKKPNISQPTTSKEYTNIGKSNTENMDVQNNDVLNISAQSIPKEVVESHKIDSANLDDSVQENKKRTVNQVSEALHDSMQIEKMDNDKSQTVDDTVTANTLQICNFSLSELQNVSQSGMIDSNAIMFADRRLFSESVDISLI